MRPLTIVIKLGTSSIVDEKTHEPLTENLSTIVRTVASLKQQGHQVVIVSSGAIGLALGQMNRERRPDSLSEVQALAAIGQCGLTVLWVNLFAQLKQTVSQVLLTRHDIADRTQYVNAQNTFKQLLRLGVVPIVNENDTISVSEIKFGDNDTLSAITAGMVNADYLFLLTDVSCLYDKNPRKFPDARPIEVVEDIDELTADVSSAGSSVGTGGMATKITAARLATSKGVTTIITKSSDNSKIGEIIASAEAAKASSADGSDAVAAATCSTKHTRFVAFPEPIRDRQFWILNALKPRTDSCIYISRKTQQALLSNPGGILPSSVLHVTGSFGQQESVSVAVVGEDSKLDWASAGVNGKAVSDATEVGRAVVSYAASEIRKIMGKDSRCIGDILGYADTEYVALKDNFAFFPETRPPSPVLGSR